jgi:probable F420-dependent oxidoreductase
MSGRPGNGLGLILELPTQRENVACARKAEHAGFESVWAPEFHNHSGALALAAAALETERVELGTSIAWAFGRSPLLTAVTALDLDEMSEGRFVLGLGTGTRRMRTDWLGAPAERPGSRLKETVEAVRAVFDAASAGGIEFDREHVRLSVRPYARSGQVRPRVPIYVAAVNEGMSRVAGEVADGVVAHPMASARYIAEVMRPAIARGAQSAGRSGGDVAVADWLVVGVSDDPDQAREDVKRQIAFHATVRTYDRALELHGFMDAASEIRSLWKRWDLPAMTALVSDEMLAAMGVAGSPEECRDQVAERGAASDRLLLGAPIVATDPGRIRDYHTAILETFGAIPAGGGRV